MPCFLSEKGKNDSNNNNKNNNSNNNKRNNSKRQNNDKSEGDGERVAPTATSRLQQRVAEQVCLASRTDQLVDPTSS